MTSRSFVPALLTALAFLVACDEENNPTAPQLPDDVSVTSVELAAGYDNDPAVDIELARQIEAHLQLAVTADPDLLPFTQRTDLSAFRTVYIELRDEAWSRLRLEGTSTGLPDLDAWLQDYPVASIKIEEDQTLLVELSDLFYIERLTNPLIHLSSVGRAHGSDQAYGIPEVGEGVQLQIEDDVYTFTFVRYDMWNQPGYYYRWTVLLDGYQVRLVSKEDLYEG
jgi:hypothetical protein